MYGRMRRARLCSRAIRISVIVLAFFAERILRSNCASGLSCSDTVFGISICVAQAGPLFLLFGLVLHGAFEPIVWT